MLPLFSFLSIGSRSFLSRNLSQIIVLSLPDVIDNFFLPRHGRLLSIAVMLVPSKLLLNLVD
jgi:hypothetical protein